MNKSIPNYSVRINKRAKRVILKIKPGAKLEIVVPARFDQRQLPSILDSHAPWIKEQLGKYQNSIAPTFVPESVNLQALNQVWHVEHKPGPDGTMQTYLPGRLIMSGLENDVERASEILHLWLREHAKVYLKIWLDELSMETGLPYAGLTIRCQKTRWGSCSSKHHINLNYKLLFLRPALVRHVLVHELCHTRHLNHSAKFWALVEQFDSDYRALNVEMREAWKHMPNWLHL